MQGVRGTLRAAQHLGPRRRWNDLRHRASLRDVKFLSTEPAPGGSLGNNLFVRTQDGEFFLKRYRPWHSMERVRCWCSMPIPCRHCYSQAARSKCSSASLSALPRPYSWAF